MANCNQCLCEKVCRYNDGHNLYCKKDYDCPHFTSANKIREEFAERLLEKAEVDENYHWWVSRLDINNLVKEMENKVNTEKQFYTPEDVEKMTCEQLADDAIWEKVKESMKKWNEK